MEIFTSEVLLGAVALGVFYKLASRALDLGDRCLAAWTSCRACKERRDA